MFASIRRLLVGGVNAWGPAKRCAHPLFLSHLAAYVCWTLGINFILLYFLSLANPARMWAKVLLVYGRSPLIFYVVHFWVSAGEGEGGGHGQG